MKKYIEFIKEGKYDIWQDLYNKIGTDIYTISEPDNNVDKICSLKTGKVLDIGVGDGSNAKRFFDNGCDVWGLDIAESAITRVKKEIPGHWFLHNLEEPINLPENLFDVIFARLSLHYFDDQTISDRLQDFNKLLKNDGLFFMSVKLANVGNRNTGKVMRTTEEWEDIIEKNGFDIVNSNEVVKKPYDYDPAPSNMLEIYAKPIK